MNSIIHGSSEEELKNIESQSVGLIFTSPPYFNAKPEYSEYFDYETYLSLLRKVIKESHRVLSEGRFFVINVSPVLIKRTSRTASSKRLALPFDIHQIFIQENFDFIDDIIWVKPEGAGWVSNRGRRFSADRTPLQYKTVPVTEYVLVYRKRTEKLIDWNIRKHDQELVNQSKIDDDYERTNVWQIPPKSSADHPAVFPYKLAENVIKYYSFVNDLVLDPFAGSGTVGEVALKLKRKYILIEKKLEYVNTIKRKLNSYYD